MWLELNLNLMERNSVGVEIKTTTTRKQKETTTTTTRDIFLNKKTEEKKSPLISKLNIQKETKREGRKNTNFRRQHLNYQLRIKLKA